MSVEEAAESIWSHSDVIGFGYVSTIDNPEQEQQFIDMVLALKGAADRRYDYAPLRRGRIRSVGPGLYRLPARPDEIVFVSLVRTPDGYVIPACRELVFAKDRMAIIRRLVAIARQGHTSTAAH
ncbi:hypothetical protein RCO27_08355 [Sphingosinicella sp. LHD-64]|uniref:hypothetical protein n=1 Tax=Sphingosinicella sp. LHD-64 TaxID=3072139 RepID=UPI0028101440|nr:hypothetical protein [Sphingosinicella sp. LHD-64]MDQ8756242.1 hypothetical protein [Sphingosinicella sp. LHD-64]